jgi:glycerophosphoryl diester phosphodiesterase
MKIQVLTRHIWLLGVVLSFVAGTAVQAQTAGLHRLHIDSPQALKQFFTYSPDRIPFISAHRGGARKGYPENCLATFENTLRHTPAMMEVDPRYTKDSVIVLLHDPTLDRTTNGKGKVADFTWAELQQLRLKDTEGNLTEYKIPMLDEALEWAKGKTILILDKKDVPLAVRVRKIQEHKAEAYALVMAYNFNEARQCYGLSKDIMMEVFVPNQAKLAEYEQTGVPWENSVVFIAHAKAQDKALYDLLHQKGVMCMIGSSRIYDQEFTLGKTAVYADIINEGADIIEADLAIEAGQGIRALVPQKSSKDKFFIKAGTQKKRL